MFAMAIQDGAVAVNPLRDSTAKAFRWGGPRHAEIDDVRAQSLASSVWSTTDHWFGVHDRFEPGAHADHPARTSEGMGSSGVAAPFAKGSCDCSGRDRP
jgi:hypothetical protein